MRFTSKLKITAATAGMYALYLISACVLIMLVEWLFLFLLDHIILLDYPVITVLRIVIYTGGVTAIIGFLGYYEGYREMACPVKESIVSYCLALIPHILLAMLFGFQGFIAGGVRFTAGLIFHGWKITAEKLAYETPEWVFLLGFLGYSILYGAALVLCKYFGAQKRICDRAELRGREGDGSAQ